MHPVTLKMPAFIFPPGQGFLVTTIRCQFPNWLQSNVCLGPENCSIQMQPRLCPRRADIVSWTDHIDPDSRSLQTQNRQSQ
jgi:hypothetical protein